MKTLALLLAFVIAGVAADGFGSHGHRHSRRLGRRFRQGRINFRRRGRQEDIAAADPITEAPLDQYGAALDAAETAFADYAEAPLDQYGSGDNSLSEYDYNDYGSDDFGADAAAAASGDANLAMLEKSVPGIPGQDYPIYSEVPDTAFSCDGQVEGGYYADPEAECQVFHICTADGEGGLAKYSFLCPNGTIFNQNYFICDWWFNFDCAEAESLYARNDEIRAEQEANVGAVAAEDAALPAYDDYAAYDDVPLDDSLAPVDYEEAPLDQYGAAPVDEVPVFEESATSAPIGTYGAPPAEDAAAEEERVARRFRNQRGRGSRNRSFRRRNNSRRNSRRLNNRRRNSSRSRQARRFRGFNG